MAKKKKRRLRAEKEVRRVARIAIGTPPAERIIVEKRRRDPKHKKSVLESPEE